MGPLSEYITTCTRVRAGDQNETVAYFTDNMQIQHKNLDHEILAGKEHSTMLQYRLTHVPY
jgi:hypothetical protein